MNKNNRNYLKWREEMSREGDVARGLRFAVFALSTALVAVLAWIGLCHAVPVVLRFEAQEQERLQAEYEGLQDAYDAELLREIERSAGE